MKSNKPTCFFMALMLLAVGCQKKEAATPEALCQAARAGNIKRVRSLISRGVDVNARIKNDRTPLHHAAKGGHKNTAELLIAKG
ncbi:MAG: ankyrin repeat domain-containing protein, partial [Planctomycetota bacterium]